MTVRIICGDALTELRKLPDESVNCICTSPPYWRQRDYGVAEQIGLEATPEEYIDKLTIVFREARRVLRSNGVCWINVGDKWASGGNGGGGSFMAERGHAWDHVLHAKGWRSPPAGYKDKDLIGIPFMLAFALRADGWYWRQCNVWAKCLSGGAIVYARTQKGDMPVPVKDLVRLDPRTIKLWSGKKWIQVTGWGPSLDDGERLEFVLRSGERIGCTGGHQWPTERGNVETRNLQIGDILKTCLLPEPDNVTRPPYLIDDALWFVGLFLA